MRSGTFAGGSRPLRLLLLAGGVIGAPGLAWAQQADQPAPAPAQERPIGPAQLQDFQLQPRERIVSQPRPAPATQQPATPSPAATPAPRQAAPTPPTADQRTTAPTQERPANAPVARTPTEGAAPAPVPTVAPAPASTDPPAVAASLPEAATPATVGTPSPSEPAPLPASDGSVPLWLLLLGGLGLGIGVTFLLRRRAGKPLALAAPVAATSAMPAEPRAPRPDPVPRAWIEVELRPERTTADPAESVVEFEMTIRNTGGSIAKNVQLQAKLICSTPEQDKEIAAFQRKKPGEHRTLDIPDLPPGQELKLKGRVDVKQEEMRVMRIDQRLLFVPLVAVNAFYDWGTVRKGQTSKSFLVGRERSDSPSKMAPFRLDLGPRVYRTLGMRPYKVERRV